MRFAVIRALTRAFAVTLALVVLSAVAGHADGSKVTLAKNGNQWQLLVNGAPFFIKGAGGTSHLQDLKDLGGNSIRTWGIESMEEQVDGKPLVERAQDLGLMIACGIWLKQQRNGFNYDDSSAVEAQRQAVRDAVTKYKDSPALLVWGLGNETEGPMSDGSDLRVWKEINTLAGMVKEIDPNHPVMTVIAGASSLKIQNVLKYCPNVDILGINAYGGAEGAGAACVSNGWNKPFVLTEFGPLGQWETNKTAWGAPLEATANEKAASYYATQSLVTSDAKDICLGTYAFLWGYKNEATPTWYGMFLQDGERLPQADAMSKAWTGNWPATRCPKIKAFTSSAAQKSVGAGSQQTASVEAIDPGGKTLTYDWAVMDEQEAGGVGGDAEAALAIHPECISGSPGPMLTFTAPQKAGAYRLYITIHNGANGATTANTPFQVQ